MLKSFFKSIISLLILVVVVFYDHYGFVQSKFDSIIPEGVSIGFKNYGLVGFPIDRSYQIVSILQMGFGSLIDEIEVL